MRKAALSELLFFLIYGFGKTNADITDIIINKTVIMIETDKNTFDTILIMYLDSSSNPVTEFFVVQSSIIGPKSGKVIQMKQEMKSIIGCSPPLAYSGL